MASCAKLSMTSRVRKKQGEDTCSFQSKTERLMICTLSAWLADLGCVFSRSLCIDAKEDETSMMRYWVRV